jgi:hypothetical protein
LVLSSATACIVIEECSPGVCSSHPTDTDAHRNRKESKA